MKTGKLSIGTVMLFSMAALLFASSAFAIPAEPCDVQPQVCCEKPNPGPMAFAYPKDVGLSCPTDFTIFGEFLLMQAQEGGLEYGVSGFLNNAYRIQGQGTNHHDWNWNPGFRIGIGGYSPHDNWNLDARWTYLRIKDTASSGRGLYPLYLGAFGVPFSYGSEKWKTHFNTLDLSFGKPYYISRSVIWHPYFCLSGAWLDQDIHITYKVADFHANVYASNDFWGIGLRAGLESEWIIGAGWKFIGTASSSLLFGRFDFSQEATSNFDLSYNIHHELYEISPNFELGLALNWGTHFSSNRYYLNMQVGYEFHYWLQQNHMVKFTTSYDSGDYTVSNYFSLNGLAFRLEFDF